MSAIQLLAAAYREVGAGAIGHPHRHAQWQWFVVTGGEIELTLDNQMYVVKSGHSLLVGSETERSYLARESARFIWVRMSSENIDLTRLQEMKLPIGAELQPDLHALVEELIHPGSADTTELAQALMTRLLIGLKRSLQSESARRVRPQVGVSREMIERLEAFMRHHLHEPLTRQQLADAVHLSPSHLARVFRSATGQTLHQRLSELRLQRARELLLESTMAITQIAQEAGFQSFSHFTSTFKADVGVTPSKFRLSRGYTFWFPTDK